MFRNVFEKLQNKRKKTVAVLLNFVFVEGLSLEGIPGYDQRVSNRKRKA